MPSRSPPLHPVVSPRPARPHIALVLQGGGALGAYHLGAYQALHEAGLDPDWVAGISIGAINACVLAGNEPEQRLGKLQALWDEISRPGDFAAWLHGPWRVAANQASFMQAALFGQPHFWQPRWPSPLLATALEPEQAGWYDTSPLLQTLPRFADFERINAARTRLSLGATCVTTGELEYFDNFNPHHRPIRPEHVLASGSLPPAFAATRVGDKLYWDGGCVSNTPLNAIYQNPLPGHTVVFMIDLWNAQGEAPTTMDAVAWRQKQIQYASRTTWDIERVAARHNHRWALRQLADEGQDVHRFCGGADLEAADCRATFEIVHIIYQPAADQISASDAEFSRTSIAERRAAGLVDMRTALAARAPAAALRGPATAQRSPAAAAAARPQQGTTVTTLRSGDTVAATPR